MRATYPGGAGLAVSECIHSEFYWS